MLGMPFLAKQGCTLDLGKPVIRLQDRELKCTDRYGRLRANTVQVVRNTTIPAMTKANMLGTISTWNHSPQGVVVGPCVAASLNSPGPKGQILIRYLNPA